MDAAGYPVMLLIRSELQVSSRRKGGRWVYQAKISGLNCCGMISKLHVRKSGACCLLTQSFFSHSIVWIFLPFLWLVLTMVLNCFSANHNADSNWPFDQFEENHLNARISSATKNWIFTIYNCSLKLVHEDLES